MVGTKEERTIRFEGMSLVGVTAAPTKINYKATLMFEGDPDAFDYSYVHDFIPKRAAKSISGVEMPLDHFRFGSLKFESPGMAFATIKITLDAESVEVAKLKIKVAAMMDHATFVSVLNHAGREIPSTGIELVLTQANEGVQGDIIDNEDDNESLGIGTAEFDPQ